MGVSRELFVVVTCGLTGQMLKGPGLKSSVYISRSSKIGPIEGCYCSKNMFEKCYKIEKNQKRYIDGSWAVPMSMVV